MTDKTCVSCYDSNIYIAPSIETMRKTSNENNRIKVKLGVTDACEFTDVPFMNNYDSKMLAELTVACTVNNVSFDVTPKSVV